jgi:hypothetical protein
MSPLIIRQRATQTTEVAFRGRPIDFKQRTTCVHMAYAHVRAMGIKVPKLPPLRGMKSALRALSERGFKTTADVMDFWGFERIPPAAMLLGDVAWRGVPEGVEFAADRTRMGGLLVCVGPHKLMGWFGNAEAEGKMVVMDMSFDQVDAAWRVCPRS